MGAGDEPFGDPIPDPLVVANDPTIAERPRAIYFDPISRDFPLDASGEYEDVHPVDAAVATLLENVQGRIRSSPSTGWPIDKIRNFFTPQAASEVDGLVRAALASLIARGDVTYLGLTYDSTNPAGPAQIVRYQNNRLRTQPKTPPQIYLGK